MPPGLPRAVGEHDGIENQVLEDPGQDNGTEPDLEAPDVRHADLRQREFVGTGAAGARVRAFATVRMGRPGPAEQPVVALVAVEGVGAVPALQNVAVPASDHLVGAAPADRRVGRPQAVESVAGPPVRRKRSIPRLPTRILHCSAMLNRPA